MARANAAAVAAIADDDAAPGPARKAARRGIQVLKARKVTIPERPKIARPSAEDAAKVEAWFRPPDAAGGSAFTLASRLAPGRLRLVDVILKPGAGLLSVSAMEMSRSQLESTFAGIAARFGVPPVPVPIEWARARIAKARADNDASRTILPLGFDANRDLLGPAPVPDPPHPADGHPRSEPRDDVLAISAKLHAEPELKTWLPEPVAMQAMLISLQARLAQTPGEGGAEVKQRDLSRTEELVGEVIDEATDRYFDSALRTDYASRLKDVAISMIARGANERASVLLTVESALRDPAASPRKIPFLRAFFEKAFGVALARAAKTR